MEMNQNKLEANAGNNSCQIQAKQIVINNGCTAEEVRRISRDIFEISKKEFTQDAYVLANKRVKQFEDIFVARIEKLENAMIAFQDPAFQRIYIKAQQEAACTDQKNDYEILAELLADRISCQKNSYESTGISHAIQVVDEIADDALLGLTVSFVLLLFKPTSLYLGLDNINDAFKYFPLSELPQESRWLTHLDLLGLVDSAYGDLYLRKSFSAIFFTQNTMFGNYGIKKDSEQYDDILIKLRKVNLEKSVDKILVKHELNPKYLRMNIRNAKDINSLIDDLPISSSRKNIKYTLQFINQRYFQGYRNGVDAKILKNFNNVMSKRVHLLQAVNWWNIRKKEFFITEPGIAIAYANFKRLCPDFDISKFLQ